MNWYVVLTAAVVAVVASLLTGIAIELSARRNPARSETVLNDIRTLLEAIRDRQDRNGEYLHDIHQDLDSIDSSLNSIDDALGTEDTGPLPVVVTNHQPSDGSI